MAKKPGLLDLVALVPAADIARTAKALGLDPETLTRRLLALDASGISSRLVDTATRALKPGEAGRLGPGAGEPERLSALVPRLRRGALVAFELRLT